jgi:uncharacterized protein with FMN-binding domain
MRRALLAIAGTVVGLVMLMSFKTHVPPAPAAQAAPEPSASGKGNSSSSASSGLSGTSASSAPSGSPTSHSSSTLYPSPRVHRSSASPASSTSPHRNGQRPAAVRIITGRVISTPYGPVQVEVGLSSGRIIGVRVLQRTNTDPRSLQIDSVAFPQLTREALAAQSARIHMVSGASYTSAGYIQSLQSALDRARA